MWHELVGTPKYYAGTAGTVTLGAGEVLISIVVHASAGSATVTLFGGTAIPIINGAAPTELRFAHTLWQATSVNGGTIVLANTDSYFVHSVKEGHAS